MDAPPLKTAEQYESEHYQRTAEIESRAMHGLTYEERAKREADFMVQSAGLDLEPGDKILDLASGIAEHANIMRTKTEADVDVRELSETLVTQAKSREAIRQTSSETRGRLDIALGNMGHVLDSIPTDAKYKLITIGGSSFMYLPTEGAHKKALADYLKLLEPGGKLVLQFRERVKPSDEAECSKWCRGLGVQIENKKAEGESEHFGRFAKSGENVTVLTDTGTGDGFYFYHVDTLPIPHGEGNVPRHSFGRAYIRSDGSEEDMGPTHIIDLMSRVGVEKGLNPMLEQVGFRNIHLEEQPLSPDGAWHMFAVVAEK